MFMDLHSVAFLIKKINEDIDISRLMVLLGIIDPQHTLRFNLSGQPTEK